MATAHGEAPPVLVRQVAAAPAKRPIPRRKMCATDRGRERSTITSSAFRRPSDFDPAGTASMPRRLPRPRSRQRCPRNNPWRRAPSGCRRIAREWVFAARRGTFFAPTSRAYAVLRWCAELWRISIWPMTPSSTRLSCRNSWERFCWNAWSFSAPTRLGRPSRTAPALAKTRSSVVIANRDFTKTTGRDSCSCHRRVGDTHGRI